MVVYPCGLLPEIRSSWTTAFKRVGGLSQRWVRGLELMFTLLLEPGSTLSPEPCTRATAAQVPNLSNKSALATIIVL